jgi:hypothetical protein
MNGHQIRKKKIERSSFDIDSGKKGSRICERDMKRKEDLQSDCVGMMASLK